FDTGKMVPTVPWIRPSEYVINRLEAFKHASLRFFTREGLKGAAGLVDSKHVKLDYDLSFIEFLIAKNYFLAQLQLTKWPARVIGAFHRFFFYIETHEL
ncbi:hypothetical protein F5J12DRAFT_717855, partial [Pisolithus orientalis]|uniref:uncharacterized protein n=1 Tax=Pisolithus orientalis TaxID=936130 RepID=UPI002224D93F